MNPSRQIASLAFFLVTLCSDALGQDAPAAWGAVKGRLVWDGDKIPTPKRIVSPLLPAGVEVFDDTLLVNAKNRGVRNGLVWLMPAAKEPLKIHPDLSAIKPRERMMIVQGYRYHPPVIALRAGQDLRVKNGDPHAYSFRWMPHPRFNESGNVVLPPGASYAVKGLKAQPIPIAVGSNLHSWMSGYIAVVDHPYFAVTDEDGRFEIPLAPAGSIRVLVWHQTTGWVGGDGRKGSEHAIPGGAVRDLGDVKMKN